MPMFFNRRKQDADELKRMNNDEDIVAERLDRATVSERPYEPSGRSTQAKLTIKDNPFLLVPGTGGHRVSAISKRLLDEFGGVEALKEFTNHFYEMFKQDKHLDQFLRDHDDPHGERFAFWIAEKFGHGTPWTNERRTRKQCPFSSHGYQFETPYDRSSAHYVAWHSPKRNAKDFGKHFKLDDSRNWMRLHFKALRDVGGYERSPAFCDYYIRFIGHFVSIYESSATLFARESARWSADPANWEKYVQNGRRMKDVLGVTLNHAIRDLPPEEARDRVWPYPRR